MISGRLCGSSVTPIRVGFVLCCIIAAGLIGCDREEREDREPGVEFDPPAGTYESPQLVRLVVPAAEAVYVSIDGRDPDASRCRPFDGSPIELNGSAEIKVVLVRDGKASPPFVGEYLIAGDEEAAGNAAMLEAWFKYEEATRRKLMDENNGGKEPGLGQLGKRWTLQDGKGGKMDWITEAEGFKGRTTFTYEDYEFNGLRVRGVLIGRFDTKGTGRVRTRGGRALVLTGTHSGTIDDQARLERKVRAAGHYSVTCSGEDCASGPTRHLAPDWKIASTAKNNRGGSCAPAPEPLAVERWFQIRHASSGRCLEHGHADDLVAVPCDRSARGQHWLVAGRPDAVVIRSAWNRTSCIADRGTSAFDTNVVVSECRADSRQRWRLLVSQKKARIQGHRRPFCLFVPEWGGSVIGTNGNCGLVSDAIRWEFWERGGAHVRVPVSPPG